MAQPSDGKGRYTALRPPANPADKSDEHETSVSKLRQFWESGTTQQKRSHQPRSYTVPVVLVLTIVLLLSLDLRPVEAKRPRPVRPGILIVLLDIFREA